MEFYFASCDDGILLLCRSGASVLRRYRILSRVFQRREILFHLGMTMRNSIPLRRCEISVLRRREILLRCHKIYLTSISRRHRIFLVSILWRHGILFRFGAATTQNFISLRNGRISVLRRSIRLNSERFTARRYCGQRLRLLKFRFRF